MSEENDTFMNALDEVATAIVKSARDELLNLTEDEVRARWWFRWREDASIEVNIYQFSDMLEMYKKECREWETHHHGSTCVVERVRDKYLMPLIRDFATEMKKRQ